jgi:hypothetical protein
MSPRRRFAIAAAAIPRQNFGGSMIGPEAATRLLHAPRQRLCASGQSARIAKRRSVGEARRAEPCLNHDAARLPKTVKAMQDGSVDFGACDEAEPQCEGGDPASRPDRQGVELDRLCLPDPRHALTQENVNTIQNLCLARTSKHFSMGGPTIWAAAFGPRAPRWASRDRSCAIHAIRTSGSI